MSEQSRVNGNAITDDEPMVSVQSQIGLVLTALASVIAFVFHKDYAPIVPAITTVAFAIYGAAIAISRAIKHKANVAANTQMHLESMAWREQQRLATVEGVNTAFGHVSEDVAALVARVNAVEKKVSPPRKTAAKKTTAQRR